ncbi:MAG: hypothetical protein WC719_04655 [Patescibacteria group bacterium]|jgi:hypothetical protein
MKKLFIVFGKGSEEMQYLISGMKELIAHDNNQIVFPSSHLEHEVLEETLESIRKIGDHNNNNNVVVYAGDNMDLLKANMPCACFSLTDLKDALAGVMDNNDTPLAKLMVKKMLKGALMELMNGDEE